MYFSSKRDSWLFILNLLVVIACFGPLFSHSDYGVLFFTVPLALLLIWCWFTTGYKVTEDKLIIRSGPFKSKIDIQRIRSIRPTKNPLSSFALSIDRLEISYDPQYQMALISPKDKQAFINHLTDKNPNILMK